MTAPYPGNPVRVHAEGAERTAIIRGLAALAGWLEDHPEAPLGKWGAEIQVCPAGGVAGVRRKADELGIRTQESTSSVRATVSFGRVAYVLYAPKTGSPS